MIGPNNNPPILIKIPSTVTLHPGYVLKIIPKNPAVIRVKSKIATIAIEITIAILAIPLTLILGNI
jgi:hypothetical protein